MIELADRQRGALWGLAVGDALGAAIEFAPRDREPAVVGYRAGSPHPIEAGEWTDDTSMALALADSLGRGFDPADQLRNYLDWWQTGRWSVNGECFDIGGTILQALSTFRTHSDPLSCAPTDERSSGNGSLMRLAPVVIEQAGRPSALEDLVERAVRTSVTTHGSEQCSSACAWFAALLDGAIRGAPKDEVLSESYEPTLTMRDSLHPAVRAIAEGSFRQKTRDQISSSGWVVATLEAALWAVHSGADFAEQVLLAVNLGHDSDTVGAVCGQLAGALAGYSGIPSAWREGLARPEMIEDALRSLGVPPRPGA